MKKIINGKCYNTETAQELATYSNGLGRRDFSHYEETLYRTKKGAYFLYGMGGPASKYSVADGNGWSGGSDIRVLTEAGARAWMEKYADAEDYEKAFGAVEEA